MKKKPGGRQNETTAVDTAIPLGLKGLSAPGSENP
jgi:hypothetical protein